MKAMKKMIQFMGMLLRLFLSFCLLGVGAIVYDYYTFESRYARDVLSCPSNEELEVVKVVRKGFFGGGFALFLHMPKAQFEAIKLQLKDYPAWYPLVSGVQIDVNDEHVLRVPQDVEGVYALDATQQGGGLARMIIWDESRELLLVLAAEAML